VPNRLEAEGRAGRLGRLADFLTRLDFVILDELGYLPLAQAGGQLDTSNNTNVWPAPSASDFSDAI
jgi:hypothetical protein